MSKKINSKNLIDLFQKSGDIVQRPINIGHKGVITYLFGVDGLMNTMTLDASILRPISTDESLKEMANDEEVIKYLLEGGAYHAFALEVNDFELLVRYILSGMAALVFDNVEKALIFDVRTFDKRSIQEPSDEGVMKGF